jgi:hypothetical protein
VTIDWKDAEAIAGLRYGNLSDFYFNLVGVYLASDEAIDTWLVSGIIANGITQALIKKPRKGA